MNEFDQLTRFSFAEHPVRGELATLSESYSTAIASRSYSPAEQQLLGEALAAVSLLHSMIKIDGSVILQLQTPGPVKVLMAEANQHGEVRAILRNDESGAEVDPNHLSEGTMAITIEPDHGERYQGIVPLTGAGMASCLEEYFQRSEQLDTRFMFFKDDNRICGLMLQNLPDESDNQALNHCSVLAQTLTAEEACHTSHETLLYRLYHQDQVAVLLTKPLAFVCSCSEQRSLNAILSIEQADVEEILEQDGKVSMTCEFCHTTYMFDRATIEAQREPQTLH